MLEKGDKTHISNCLPLAELSDSKSQRLLQPPNIKGYHTALCYLPELYGKFYY